MSSVIFTGKCPAAECQHSRGYVAGCNFGNTGHINNINNNSVIPSHCGAACRGRGETSSRHSISAVPCGRYRKAQTTSGVLVGLVLGVALRLQLECAVLGVEVRAQAGGELVQHLVGPAGAQYGVLHHHVGGEDRDT